MPTCPKGHLSTEPDYCSECGARIATPDPQPAAGQPCPDCGTPHDDPTIVFCEICGYNFTTHTHGDLSAIPPPPAPASIQPSAQEASGAEPPRWLATLTLDPTPRDPTSPEPPADPGPILFPLATGPTLVGRRSAARAIFPEISLATDDAVSHRHALLHLTSEGTLTLRDIGSSNGTRLNGTDLTPMRDYPIHPGDTVTLGHGSRLTLTQTWPESTAGNK